MTNKEKKALLSFAFDALEQLKTCEGKLDPDDIPCVAYLAYQELHKLVITFVKDISNQDTAVGIDEAVSNFIKEFEKHNSVEA